MFLDDCRFRVLTQVLVAFASIVPLGAQQSSEPRVGVYHCTNGFILTISRCEKLNGADACFFKVENKGQVLMDSPGSRAGVAKMLRACNGDPTAAQAATSPSATSGVTNPPYIAEMPNSDRVMKAMQTGDPRETATKQLAAFYYLSEIVKTLAGGKRELRAQYTPDELRVLNDYSAAQYKVAQAADAAFPGPYKGEHKFSDYMPYHLSRYDPRFGVEVAPVFETLLPPDVHTLFQQAAGQQAAGVKAHWDAERKQYEDAQKAAQNPQPSADDRYAQDAGSIAVRRCVESGRSQIECLAEGMKVGLVDLSGGNPLYTAAFLPNKAPGLRLTGIYSGGGASLMFEQDHAEFGCGGLIRDPYAYTVEQSGPEVRVTVGTHPKPLVFSFKDGALIGPGPIDVAGRVPIGGPVATTSTSYQMQTHTTTTREQVPDAALGNYAQEQVHTNGMEHSVDHQTSYTTMQPTQTTHIEIPTAPKTEHCSIGTVHATAATPKVSDVVTAAVGSEASKSQNSAPGLRLNGTYAAPGGFKIDFRADSATLECGEALSSEGYAVVPEGGQFIVRFQNSTGPLSLVLQPNGSLTGSANIDVAGRKAIRGANGGVDYQPRNARCALGTLVPAK